MLLWARLFLLLLNSFLQTGFSDYFQEIETLFFTEKAKMATKKLTDDFAGGVDHPKEISIHCPMVIVHDCPFLELIYYMSDIIGTRSID